MAKKWGKIGSPKSKKRKNWMKRASKQIDRKYKGYGSRRAFLMDKAKQAEYRPAKKYAKGIGDRGDWSATRLRKVL
jgi:hypothetical protein